MATVACSVVGEGSISSPVACKLLVIESAASAPKPRALLGCGRLVMMQIKVLATRTRLSDADPNTSAGQLLREPQYECGTR